ncbi:MAG: hypothetical protein H6662_05940 [Ardenticatenaceae bacterium]|nr:hypothetical protein [Ardenticatenaceae bacterium]
MTRQKNTRVGVDFCLIFSQGSQVTARYLPHDPQVADLIWGGYYDVELFAAALLDVGVVWMIVKIIRDSRKEQAARSAPVEE